MRRILLLLSLGTSLTHAQWRIDGVAICDTIVNTSPNGTIPQIAPDGTGGAYICWVDLRNGDLDIYAQHVDSAGTILWQRNGVPVVTAPGSQGNMQIVNDGFGNAIIAWEDDRSIVYTDIYAQKLTPSGTTVWPTNGVKATEYGGLDLRVAPDGAGGLVLGWTTGGIYDVAVQRLDSLGNRIWGDSGVLVTNRTSTISQGDVWIVNDEKKGAIVVWTEHEISEIFCQRVDSSGTVRWQKNGILLSDTVSANLGVASATDGEGGAIVSWLMNIQGGDAYAQRIDSSGVIKWTQSGVHLGSAGGGGGQRNISDGVGGALIGHGLFIQHVNSGGTKFWQSSGVPFTTLPSVQSSMARTSEGGVWNFCSSLLESLGSFLYTQWIDGSGLVRWGTNGRRLLTHNASQERPKATDDGRGHCFVVWDDFRHGYWGIYVAKIDTNGIVAAINEKDRGMIPGEPSLHQNYPNPFNSSTVIRYYLPSETFVSLKVFDVLGRELRTLVQSAETPGEHQTVFRSERLASGIFFYRLTTQNYSRTRKMILIR